MDDKKIDDKIFIDKVYCRIKTSSIIVDNLNLFINIC